MKEKIPHRNTTESQGVTRRSFLTKALHAAYVAGALTIPSFYFKADQEATTESDETLAILKKIEEEIRNALQETEKNEAPHERKLIPEWERTGNDLLITTGYNANDVEKGLGNDWGKILKSFLPGTHVHVVSTAGTKTVLESRLRNTYPHLKFSIYELPITSFHGNAYSQDMLFSGGLRDERGRFIIYTSKLDQMQMPDALTDAYLFMEEFGDELLAANFPDRFVSRPVPLKCEGGDLQPTRLPNGETALVLGDANFRTNVAAIIHGANANGRRTQNGNFDYSYLLTKGAYQKLFGVDRVIVLNEDNLLKDLPGQSIDKFINGYSEFYHADMCVRTAVDPSGRYVAFVTATDTDKTIVSQKDIRHLRGVRQQFQDLGFDIVELPCGKHPALNYTNVLMFTPRNGPPTVMLPCYGDRMDDRAAGLYRSRGFRVIKTDMSNMMQSSKDRIKGGGSLHCLVEVLS